MILVIDNYDSFTYNLVQYLGELTPDIEVVRNDRITVDEVAAKNPSHILLSPGPGAPAQAGICIDVLRRLGDRIPTLGVCLGHQAIGEAFGGRVVRAPALMHGKTSHVIHDEEDLFLGLENPFEATRYHSLVIEPESLPAVLKVTARTIGSLLMSAYWGRVRAAVSTAASANARPRANRIRPPSPIKKSIGWGFLAPLTGA